MNNLELEESVIGQSHFSASSDASKSVELDSTTYQIYSTSYVEVTFANGIFIYELSRNVKVTREMAVEYMDSLAFINSKMNRPVPCLCLVNGIPMLDNGSRKYLSAHKDRGIIYASSVVTTNIALRAFAKVLGSFIGKESFPISFFDNEKQSRKWLEEQRQVFDHQFISDEEVKAAFSL